MLLDFGVKGCPPVYGLSVTSLVLLAKAMCGLIDGHDLLIKPFAPQQFFKRLSITPKHLGQILFVRQERPWPAQDLLRSAQDQQIGLVESVPKLRGASYSFLDLCVGREKCLYGMALLSRPDRPHLTERLVQ